MIRLVSCGIRNTPHKECTPRAKQNAEQIYSAFQHIFPDFDNLYSITIYDGDAEEFLRAIRNAGNDLDSTGTLVIYFSGHAVEIAEMKFQLLFRDEGFDLRQLIDQICGLKCKKILILDCCYSGQDPSLELRKQLEFMGLSTFLANDPHGLVQCGEFKSSFTQCFINSMDKLDRTNQAITLAAIWQGLKEEIKSSKIPIIVGGETDVILKDTVTIAGNTEFLHAFWSKIPTLPSSMRAVMWYALDSSNLGYDIKISTIERLYNERPRFYEGSWLVRRAIGHMLGELPQQEDRVRKAEKKLLDSKSWIDTCIGLVATRNQSTLQMQKLRRDICNRPGLPMDVIWLANLYYADNFTAGRDDMFLPRQLCETAWGVEDLFARYKEHPDVLQYLEMSVNDRFGDVVQTQKMLLNPDTFSTENSLLRIYLKCSKRGRNTASYRDKWLRSVLFGKWRDHPLVDAELETYFQNTNVKGCQRDLEKLSSATVDIKLSILGYVSSLPPDKRKKYQKALSWALKDPHPWVRRDSFLIFSDDLDYIKKTAFRNTINREHYPGVLDMIIEANTISRHPDWNNFIKEYYKGIEFCEAEIQAIESYLE